MIYKPKTSSEINQSRIETTLKKLKKGEISIQESGLNKRFDRLKKDNPFMYDDLHEQYLNVVRKQNQFQVA